MQNIDYMWDQQKYKNYKKEPNWNTNSENIVTEIKNILMGLLVDLIKLKK